MSEPCELCGGLGWVNARDLGNHTYEADACSCIDVDELWESAEENAGPADA